MKMTRFLAIFLLLISHLAYSATITEAPKRIVVLEFSLLDNLNQLGLKPVGVGTSGFLYEGSDPAYLHNIISNTTSVGAREAPSLEAIAKLKPDLIIADVDFNQNIQSQLEKIAPTLLLKGIFGSPENQIENLKTIATATHSNAKVAAVINHYQTQFLNASKIAKSGGQSNILIGFPTANNSFNALANNSVTSHILEKLGKKNLITQDTSSQLFELSMEGLLAKNPDQIVIMITNNDKSAYRLLEKNLLWKQLNAVKNNKVYFADRNIWGKSHGLEALELMYQEGIQTGFLANQPAK